MTHTDTLDELIKSLISARDKADHAYGCVTVLPRSDCKLVKRQIESCMQSLHFLSKQLDQTEYGEMASEEQPLPSV